MYFNVKARATKNNVHVSGAEKIVDETNIEKALVCLSKRVAHNDYDEIILKIKPIQRSILYAPLVKGCYGPDKNKQEARLRIEQLLLAKGLDAKKIMDIFYGIENMRGAILLDVHTHERLEPDKLRGIRVSTFDALHSGYDSKKDHIREAKLLASKVVAHENIVGELCVTDDINYTFGYFATKQDGLVGIAHIKDLNESWGGRIILFDSDPGDGTYQEKVARCIDYLENAPVLIYNEGEL